MITNDDDDNDNDDNNNNNNNNNNLISLWWENTNRPEALHALPSNVNAKNGRSHTSSLRKSCDFMACTRKSVSVPSNGHINCQNEIIRLECKVVFTNKLTSSLYKIEDPLRII